MDINNKFTSPNFAIRLNKIKFIIIHYTEMYFEEALAKLCSSESNVSSHFLIKSCGEVFQLVAPENTAWHAGVSSWQNHNKLNDHSIGIELDNLGNHLFSENQIKSCINLCHKLIQTYNIPPINVLGHSDIAPNRKIDPGIFFNWAKLAEFHLGLWHAIEKLTNSETALLEYGNYGIYVFNLQKKLKTLGYEITLTGNYDKQTNFVVRAFQSHFNPEKIKKLGLSFYCNNESKYNWDEHSESILNKLILTLKKL